ncbi:MAG: biopolymer transporter ExbD [Candidatus Marinimicrobia bacterium]|nr:biopolymer transporter ExbD [Candidatus Neomarinimicrobiota bacterium]
MAFKRRTIIKSEISTASMPDIIFMLLVFFMVTTVLREYEGLPIALPSATKIEKLESKRHTTHVWINKSGLISIDDKRVSMSAVRTVMFAKISADMKLTTSLKADKDTPMRIILDVQQEFRHANALKVNYSSKRKAP